MPNNVSEDANDQAPSGEVQDRPPHGPEYLGRPKSPINKREYGPGQQAAPQGQALRLRRQLRASRSSRATTPTCRAALPRIYDEARRLKGDTAPMIGSWSAGSTRDLSREFVPTFSRRQFVSHGHIT